MPDLLKATSTRFRAYQLCQAGSSFSYFDGQHFTLIEAIATEASKPSLQISLIFLEAGKNCLTFVYIVGC